MISTRYVVENKEQVLQNIPEIEIFKFYLGINVTENDYFINPLRNDNTPTCSFHRNKKDRLILTDWSGWFSGDCFEFVMFLKDYTFQEALRHIWISLSGKEYHWPAPKKRRNGKIAFHITKHPWDENALKFWNKYHIPVKILEQYEVYPIQKFWKGGGFDSHVRYTWKPEYPAYAYYGKKGRWKIYYPAIGDRSKGFLSNGSFVQGLNQLPNDIPYLVITKSLKDVMVLKLFGIPAIAPSSENTLIPEEVMERFMDKTVFTLYDNDPTGIKGALEMQTKYLTIPLFLETSKDISDAIELIGKDELNKQLHEGNIFKGGRGSRECWLWREELQNGHRYGQPEYLIPDSLGKPLF